MARSGTRLGHLRPLLPLLPWLLSLGLAFVNRSKAHDHHHNPSESDQDGPGRRGIIPSRHELEEWQSNKYPADETVILSHTTTTAVPSLFHDELHAVGHVDEEATTHLGAEAAVSKLEASIGWDASGWPERDPDFVRPDGISGLAAKGLSAMQPLPYLPSMVDVVIPTIRDLEVFLGAWREFMEPYHLILVQDGDPDKFLKIPDWADYELYNRRDIEASLGENAWIISQKDASIRNFGFLVSRKRFVYTIDDDCLPAMGPDGKLVNPIEGHMRNLLSPSTPFFFNTIYDPFREGSDFVRGYPYSLRAGVATAVSHGLWLNNYDYDAPTQLLKVHERNRHYADATVTVPKGVLYPLCSMNVAFNRMLIGPAFMQGLMGVGQPWSRYDDMWAGWASKTVADHLNIGCKSGAPYIKHNKASNPFTNLIKEYKGLDWQEHAIRFFDTVELSHSTRTDASAAYVELSEKVEESLAHLNPYFKRLAKAMKTWVKVFHDSNSGKITFRSSRSTASHTRALVANASLVPRQLDVVGGEVHARLECVEHEHLELGLHESTTIERDRCSLSFTPESCTSHRVVTTEEVSSEMVQQLSRTQGKVVVLKCAVGAPFAGDRSTNINRMARELAEKGGYQLVLLMDASAWASPDSPSVNEAVPSVLAPLVQTYTKRDIESTFKERELNGQMRPRVRSMSKYYEVYSASWWYHTHGRGSAERVWVLEDDTVFSGHWGTFFSTLDHGLPADSDLMVFREPCTPSAGWIWVKWMHEGWTNLTVPGQALETWMTIYGMSASMLDLVVESQLAGTSGHIEWFPPTLALRHKKRISYISHPLKGDRIGHSCAQNPEARTRTGGSFIYCCSGASTSSAENWFEGWKQSGKCASPLLLHPVKGDACGRFSAAGFGRGCFKRMVLGSHVEDVLRPDVPTKNYFHAFPPEKL